MKNPLSVLTPAGKITLLLVLIFGLFFVYQFVKSPQGLSQDVSTSPSEETRVSGDNRTMIQKLNQLEYLHEKTEIEGVIISLTHAESFGADVGFIGDDSSIIFFIAELNSLKSFSEGEQVRFFGESGLFSAGVWGSKKTFLQFMVDDASLISSDKKLAEPVEGKPSEVSLENRGKRMLLKNLEIQGFELKYGAYLINFSGFTAYVKPELIESPAEGDSYDVHGFVYVLDEPYLRALKVDKI